MGGDEQSFGDVHWTECGLSVRWMWCGELIGVGTVLGVTAPDFCGSSRGGVWTGYPPQSVADRADHFLFCHFIGDHCAVQSHLEVRVLQCSFASILWGQPADPGTVCGQSHCDLPCGIGT